MTVRSEVETTLKTWADAQVPPVPIAFENKAFNKPVSGPYLAVFFLDTVTVNAEVSAATERETGVFQIDVCSRTGVGTKECEALRDSVVALFPVLPKTGAYSVERPPQKSAFRPRDDGFLVSHISVSYRRLQ